MTGSFREVTTASSTSSAAVPAGLPIARLVVGMVSADDAARKAIVPDGLRATSWPMLVSDTEAVATFVPVAPAVDLATLAASDASSFTPWTSTSQRSVIPDGGVNVASLSSPKRPTSIVFATVVVIDGAVTLVDDAFAWPPETSIGVVVLTPLKATMPAVAAFTAEPNVNV